MRTRLFAWVLAVIGLIAPVTLQAASFSVSNIRFSDEVGNNERFKWSVEWAPDTTLDLQVGEEVTVIYGALIIQDLPASPAKASDNDNSFQVEFDLSPFAERISVQGSPIARFSPGPVAISVDFDNRPQSFSLTDGREVSLTFLDSDKIENSGFFLLSAKIEVISKPRRDDRPKEEEMIEPMASAPAAVKLTQLGSTNVSLDASER